MKEVAHNTAARKSRKHVAAVGERRPARNGRELNRTINALDERFAACSNDVKKTNTYQLEYADNSIAVVKERHGEKMTKIVVNTSDNPKRSKPERAVTFHRKVNSVFLGAILAILTTIVLLAVFISPWTLYATVILGFLGTVSVGNIIYDNFKYPLMEIENGVWDEENGSEISYFLTSALSKNPNPQKITALIRHKYFLAHGKVDNFEFFEWVNVLTGIIDLDPEYDMGLVPLNVDHATEVFGKMLEMEEKRLAEVAQQNQLDASAKAAVQKEHEKWLDENSLNVKELAMARLEALDKLNP